MSRAEVIDDLRFLIPIMNGSDLQISVEQGDHTTVLTLSGRVSVDSSPMLRDQLHSTLLAEPGPVVIVDLTNTPSVDCSGIATLMEALKIARSRQVALRLMGLQGRLKNLFEITGVLSLFEASCQATAPSPSQGS